MRTWYLLLLCSIGWSLAGCGGGGASQPSPPPALVSVSVSSPSSILQANTTMQLQAVVNNSSNQAVDWKVTTQGALGSISPQGLYSAPSNVDVTTDVQITATSVADDTKSAALIVTVFAVPAIAVRQNNGRGEFYTTSDGAIFVPRGNDYLHFNPTMTRLMDGITGYGRSTLNSTLYDPVRTEQAMAGMESQGYNVVRTFLDILQKGDIGNESGTGLSVKYIANLADFMTRAKAHHIYVLPIFEELPWAGGYRDFITGDLETNFGTTISRF